MDILRFIIQFVTLFEGGILEYGKKDGNWGWLWSKTTGTVLALAIGGRRDAGRLNSTAQNEIILINYDYTSEEFWDALYAVRI